MKSLNYTGLVGILVIIFLSAFATPSQTRPKQPKSIIMGTLLDANDARVANAQIKIVNEHFKWEGESDEAGDFTAFVPVGTYRIYANAHGFRRFESPLNAKRDITEMVNLHLEVLVIIDRIPIPKTR